MRSKCKAETPAAAPAAEEGVTKKEKGRSTRLGLNADAEEVFEDERRQIRCQERHPNQPESRNTANQSGR